MKKNINIAIDGPSGSGKSTLAKKLAEYFGFIYIDTGALYRAIGLHVQRLEIASDDTEKIIDSLNTLNINMVLENNKGIVLLDEKPVGDEIRTPKSSAYASDVSRIPEVRSFLLELQKHIAASNDVIMDGRDIGTVILPEADVKIFLFADNRDRAKRRYEELLLKGMDVNYEEILASMNLRDSNDKNREIAPAIPAADAVLIDNSGFTPEQTFEKAVSVIKERLDI